MSNLWFTVVDLPNAPLTKLSLQDVQDIDDLKTAIKTKMPNALASYAAAQLVLKVKRHNEPDNQAQDLTNPTQVIVDVLQRFGNDCWVLVSLPPAKLTAMQFLDQIPPVIQYMDPVLSSTVPAYGVTPYRVVCWIDFVGGAHQYVPGTGIFVDSPAFIEEEDCSNETEITSVFTSNIIFNLKKFYRTTTEEALNFRQEVTLLGGGRPDYCVQRKSNTILFMELQTKWNVDSTDIIQDYNNQVGSVSPITNAIRQVFGYLCCGRLRYGVLSTYNRTWFLYRPIEDPWCLKISDCIVVEALNPTLLRSLAYIISLALQNPDCPLPPQSSYTIQQPSQPPSPQLSEIDDEDEDPTYQPSEGSSSGGFSSCKRSNTSRGNQCNTTGKWEAEGRKLRLEQFGWDAFMVTNVLGEGRSGTVYETMFRGERVAVKICDLWQHPKYHKEMLAEARMYMELEPLQGKCIPKLKGVGYTAGGLFVLVIELGGSPIVVENLNDKMRERILAALASIHSLGFLHGDIRSQNILIKSCDNGPNPNIMFIDFGFSRKISNQKEFAREMTALKNVLDFRSRLA